MWLAGTDSSGAVIDLNPAMVHGMPWTTREAALGRPISEVRG